MDPFNEDPNEELIASNGEKFVFDKNFGIQLVRSNKSFEIKLKDYDDRNERVRPSTN